MNFDIVRQLNIGGYDNNFSYFIVGHGGKKIAIVDPGDFKFLEKEITRNDFLPGLILLTHSHHDHAEALGEMVEKYKIPVYFHKNAVTRIGLETEFVRTIDDGDVIEMDGVKILAMHTPGHIDDAVCYHISGENSDDKIPKLITGDTLFVEACGRADLLDSDVGDLFKSLQRIKKLPDETQIFPGHDYGSIPISTVAHEKKYNRFLRCSNVDEFKKMR